MRAMISRVTPTKALMMRRKKSNMRRREMEGDEKAFTHLTVDISDSLINSENDKKLIPQQLILFENWTPFGVILKVYQRI
jgi:hypothetical protein